MGINPFDEPGLFDQLKNHKNEFTLMSVDNMRIDVTTSFSGGSSGHPNVVFRVVNKITNEAVDRYTLRSAIARASSQWRKK